MSNCHHCDSGVKHTLNAVVDDAVGKIYFYGPIQYEDNHVPSERCQSYVDISLQGGGGGTAIEYPHATETFDGPLVNDEAILVHEPTPNRLMFVFFNGLHLDDGVDYTLAGDTVSLNVSPGVGDRITVKYYYGGS